MRQYHLLQWGPERSIIQEFHPDNKEKTLLIVDNQYLMMLDERGLVL